jgi:hypothetical protein
MRKGVVAGELNNELDPSEMARAFLALQNGVIYLWLSDPESFSLKQSAIQFAEILLQGIGKKN